MALPRVYKDGAELRIFENSHELRVDLAEYIAQLSDSIVKERGVFSVAMSGGYLSDLMGHLYARPYSMTVEWSKWHIFLVEERIVSRDDEDSIYRNIHENFMSKVPINYRNVHYVKQNVSAEKASEKYEYDIRQYVRCRVINVSDVRDCPKFDLILLVMGEDGHVASLFPNHPALNEKNRWVTFITDSPTPPSKRITFTLPVINSASNVAVIVTGRDKANAVHLAFQNDDDDDASSSSAGRSSSSTVSAVDDDAAHNSSLAMHDVVVVPPAKFVRPTEGNLVWFLDQDAALELDGHV